MGFKKWAQDVALRSVKTAAQSAAAMLGGNAIGVTDLNWLHILDVAALAAVACVLHNLSNLNTPTSTTSVPLVTGDVERI